MAKSPSSPRPVMIPSMKGARGWTSNRALGARMRGAVSVRNFAVVSPWYARARLRRLTPASTDRTEGLRLVDELDFVVVAGSSGSGVEEDDEEDDAEELEEEDAELELGGTSEVGGVTGVVSGV